MTLLTDERLRECRTEANKILERFHVQSPNAIDIETFAWHLGKLEIKVGGLSGSEGRLVATDGDGGVIRVASDHNLGRYRFTISHELGHFCLHMGNFIDRAILKRDLGIWNNASEEAEANFFAAELLMPQFLFEPRCRGQRPGIKLLQELADEFRTSLIATAFQYWEYTNEPIALVLRDRVARNLHCIGIELLCKWG